MKLLICGDTHGSLTSAEKLLDAFKSEKADYMIFLGDIMNHGPRNNIPENYNPSKVCDTFNSIKEKVIAVRGNCDSEVDEFLLQFPVSATYQTIILGKNKLFATHGHIFDNDKIPESILPGDIFAFGHIHIPILEKQDGIIILNPGSSALPKEPHPPTYAILDDNKIAVKTFEGQNILEMELN